MARCRVRVRDVQPPKDVDTGSTDGSSLPSCLSLFLSHAKGQSTPKPSLLGNVKFNGVPCVHSEYIPGPVTASHQ